MASTRFGQAALGLMPKMQTLTPPVRTLGAPATRWGEAALSTLPQPSAPGRVGGQLPVNSMPQIDPATMPQRSYIITPPANRNQNPFFRDQNGYGGYKMVNGKRVRYDYETTKDAEAFAEKNPEGAWLGFLIAEGMGGYDRRSIWAKGQYSQARAGYERAVMSNPRLTWLRYLKTLKGQIARQWESLAGEQTGEQLPTQTKTILWG